MAEPTRASAISWSWAVEMSGFTAAANSTARLRPTQSKLDRSADTATAQAAAITTPTRIFRAVELRECYWLFNGREDIYDIRKVRPVGLLQVLHRSCEAPSQHHLYWPIPPAGTVTLRWSGCRHACSRCSGWCTSGHGCRYRIGCGWRRRRRAPPIDARDKPIEALVQPLALRRARLLYAPLPAAAAAGGGGRGAARGGVGGQVARPRTTINAPTPLLLLLHLRHASPPHLLLIVESPSASDTCAAVRAPRMSCLFAKTSSAESFKSSSWSGGHAPADEGGHHDLAAAATAAAEEGAHLEHGL